MNKNIRKLYALASKDERLIIGLMSGTSMDGLDIALCRVKNSGVDTEIEVLKFKTVSYTKLFRTQIQAVFSKRDADLQAVCLMHAEIGWQHAKFINEVLLEWNIANEAIDLIASHGQTIFHAPKSFHKTSPFPNATLQIGDGDHIAVKTGIITLSDFRQKHIAAGGEGAPLAVYGDYLMFTKKGQNRILLNIGGIANFTFLPADADPGKVFSTDVGPGNTLMDKYVQEHFNRLYDADAKIAFGGKMHPELLSELLKDEFFALRFPKTTGPELFNSAYLKKAQERSNTVHLDPAAIVATLCAFSANAIINAIKSCFTAQDDPHIYMSGGGMHNPLLVKLLQEGLPAARFFTTAELGIDPDAKEAVLFALLANEAIAGAPIDFGNRQGVPAITMGKISLPE